MDYNKGKAYAYLSLGEYALFTGCEGIGQNRAGDAYGHLSAAKTIFIKISDNEGEMLANLLLGMYFTEYARYGEAKTVFDEALRAAEDGGESRLHGNILVDALCGLGDIAAAQADYDAAEIYFQKARELCDEKRNEAKNPGVIYRLGELEQCRGNADGARSLLSQSVDMAVREGEYRIASSASRALAAVYSGLGQYKEYERCLELASKYAVSAVCEETGNEIKSLKLFYDKENARVMANAEQQMKDGLFERNSQLEKANWQLNTIYKIGQSLTSLLDIGEVIRTLYTELGALMSLDGFFIAVYNSECKSLEYKILYEGGAEAELSSEEHRLIPAGDLAYWCAYNDNTLVVGDVETERESYGEAPYISFSDSGKISGVSEAAHIPSLSAVALDFAQDEDARIKYHRYEDESDISKRYFSGDRRIAHRRSGDEPGIVFAPRTASTKTTFTSGSAVYTCLRAKGRFFGILCVRSDRIHAYNTQQVKLLDAVSTYVSIALDNATIYQKLDEVSKKISGLAYHDILTGIPNRRLLLELVPKAYDSALRKKTKVAFLFMDLDNFKPINDKFGHQAGDEVLIIFKDRVQGLIRSSDIFARMGGDEFVVVMTDLKINLNAGMLARKIIREASKPINIRGTQVSVGVSIGISIYPDDSEDTDVLLVMADEAMYRVKREVKNSFTFYGDINE